VKTRILESPSLRTNKGFTLLEMTVVVTLLALFAALIVPNVASEKAGREARQFFPKARNLMLEARGRSIVEGD
jgi:prepilin-type N-terminal cleavage/methylation domain-containing protein